MLKQAGKKNDTLHTEESVFECIQIYYQNKLIENNRRGKHLSERTETK